MQGSLIPPDLGIYNYQYPRGTDIIGMDEMNTYGQLPMGTDTIGMNEMFSYPNTHQMFPSNKYPNIHAGLEQSGADVDKYGFRQMDLENPAKDPYKQPAWYNQIFNKAGKGIRGLKNKMTEGYDQSQNFLKNIINNTMVGRIMAGFDATNPNAFNYNPALQGQIDFLKGTGQYGVMDPSGLNKITGGALAGKNLQSMFGSNDLAKMYDKSIARTEKTLANLPEQWSQLRTSDDPEDQAEYQRKLAYHRDFLQQKKDEQKKYFDSLKKKTTTGGKKNYITKTDQSGKGDGGGGSKFAGDSGAKAGTTGSWTPGGTYRGGGGHGSRTGMHRARGGRMNRGGLASLWQR